MRPSALRTSIVSNTLAAAAAALIVGSGCANATRPVRPISSSLGMQLKQQDEQLVGQRFRTLLDFETDADQVFIATPGRHALTPHTGGGAFAADAPRDAEAPTVQVKIDSLLFGAKLPGSWTLVGAYVRPDADAIVTTALLADDKVICRNQRRAYADAWVFAAVELSGKGLAEQVAAAKSLRLAIYSDGRAITIDDVLLVDNVRQLVTPPPGAAPTETWSIVRRGLTTHIDAAGRFRAAYVSTSGAIDGYTLDEANAVRARLTYRGEPWVHFPDGRLIKGGKMELLGGASKALAAAHESPADVTVDESTGRLDQSTEGDAQNDGYNESRGAYQVVARTPRLALQLVPPRGVPTVSPVLEIRGLPAGRVSAMVEGRLIETTARLPDGAALVLLPLKIERATTVTVKVE